MIEIFQNIAHHRTSTFSDLHKSKRKSVFDRILTVNEIHKRWQTKDQLEKRNLNADNVINSINTGNLAIMYAYAVFLGLANNSAQLL